MHALPKLGALTSPLPHFLLFSLSYAFFHYDSLLLTTESRFQRERKAKETDCIIAERSGRFFIVFLLPKELPRRGI